MSLYVPSAVSASDLDIAQAPYLGGEWAIYLTNKPAKLLASVVAVGDVGWQTIVSPTPGVTLSAPCHLQVSLATPLAPRDTSQAANLITSGKDGTGAPVTGNAIWQAPSRSADQSYMFERGYALDWANDGNGLWNEYLSAGDVMQVNAVANTEFLIWQLPVMTDYTFIGCTTDFRFNSKGRQPKGVDCGMESDKFIKRGKTQAGEASLDAKFKGFAESLARFDGQKCTLMAVGIKDGQVTTDRVVLTQFVPSVEINLPDGDGEAMQPSKGKFAEQLFFVAR
jgi:hypothetical protein